MKIAQQKRKENIAEYLLYMWQVEDIIRACNRDIEVIDKNVISQYQADEDTHAQMRDWWESLIKMMELENVKDKGHLQINKNVIIRLTDLHLELVKNEKYPDYGADYYRTLPFIVELRAKHGNTENAAGELETCFNALYGLLMLKLQGKEISKETEVAMAQISHFLGLLAAYFVKYEAGELETNEL
ncbi:MAG: DUF4924 family protein [Bacteroidales bacterium]|nr:DUF4924 family protein [Candidatus Sodaliphilus fimicaballi]